MLMLEPKIVKAWGRPAEAKFAIGGGCRILQYMFSESHQRLYIQNPHGTVLLGAIVDATGVDMVRGSI
jgi:hypothetical protein